MLMYTNDEIQQLLRDLETGNRAVRRAARAKLKQLSKMLKKSRRT